MDNSKLVKKYIANFIPVLLMHLIFTLIDKRMMITNSDVEVRLSLIHTSIYFYFFVIPIYLMIVNILFNAKKEIKAYYDDIKLGALSILAGNIVVLIINIISLYVTGVKDINLAIEFFIIFIPELIMFSLIQFLGSYLVKKYEEDYEEEILEGLTIPKREVEFYKKDEDKNESKDEKITEAQNEEIDEIKNKNMDEIKEKFSDEIMEKSIEEVQDKNVDEEEMIKEEVLEKINIEIEDDIKNNDDDNI